MTYRFPPGYGDYGLDEAPRDRTFTPALEAQEARERARNASTDPNWPPPDLGWRHPDANVEPTHRQSDGLLHTITPPTIEPFSPAQRAELERILLDMDCARERLRKLLERS